MWATHNDRSHESDREQYPGCNFFTFFFEAHKSKIITGNLSVTLRSAKTTDLDFASRLPGKITAIIGMIGPEVFCYINYFVLWKIDLTYIFKEVCFSGKLTQPLHYY